jgi:hypothetical protein
MLCIFYMLIHRHCRVALKRLQFGEFMRSPILFIPFGDHGGVINQEMGLHPGSSTRRVDLDLLTLTVLSLPRARPPPPRRASNTEQPAKAIPPLLTIPVPFFCPGNRACQPMADPQPPPDDGGGGHDEALWGNLQDLDIEGPGSGEPGEGWAGGGQGGCHRPRREGRPSSGLLGRHTTD